jgi:hypothetical protein
MAKLANWPDRLHPGRRYNWRRAQEKEKRAIETRMCADIASKLKKTMYGVRSLRGMPARGLRIGRTGV